jgi:hypothetical protein
MPHTIKNKLISNSNSTPDLDTDTDIYLDTDHDKYNIDDFNLTKYSAINKQYLPFKSKQTNNKNNKQIITKNTSVKSKIETKL